MRIHPGFVCEVWMGAQIEGAVSDTHEQACGDMVPSIFLDGLSVFRRSDWLDELREPEFR